MAGKSFKHKIKPKGSMPNNDDMLDAEVLFPLKYLDIFRGSLDSH